MPEELEVSSSLEQGQVVKSFLCKSHCAAQAQYGSVAGRTLARQTFLTPAASTLLTSFPLLMGTEGKTYLNHLFWRMQVVVLESRIFFKSLLNIFSPFIFSFSFF